MDFQEFKKQALVTESVPSTLPVNPVIMIEMLRLAAYSAQMIDKLKRAIYYGAQVNLEELGALLDGIASKSWALGEWSMDLYDVDDGGNIAFEVNGLSEEAIEEAQKVNLRMLHGVIGMFTESGELVEAVLKSFETGELDMVNVAEETGDSDWYKAIIHDVSGTDERDTRAKVIAKLRKRFGEKFSAFDALNRNLVEERKALEGDATA